MKIKMGLDHASLKLQFLISDIFNKIEILLMRLYGTIYKASTLQIETLKYF